MSSLKNTVIPATVISEAKKSRRRVHIETSAEGFGSVEVIVKKSSCQKLPEVGDNIGLSRVMNEDGKLIARSFRLITRAGTRNNYVNIPQVKFAR